MFSKKIELIGAWIPLVPLLALAPACAPLRLPHRSSGPMKLDADAGLRTNGRPIEVGAITFVPSRAI